MRAVLAFLALPVVPVLAFSLLPQRESPAPSIAFVSAQRISAETVEGKAGVARVQALQRERTADLRTKQQALEETRRELARTTIDAAERVKLQAQEQSQRTELERAAARAQLDLQALQRDINQELRGKVVGVLEEVAKEKRVQVVLNAETAVVWAAPELDLTAEVIARMSAAPAAPPQ